MLDDLLSVLEVFLVKKKFNLFERNRKVNNRKWKIVDEPSTENNSVVNSAAFCVSDVKCVLEMQMQM